MPKRATAHIQQAMADAMPMTPVGLVLLAHTTLIGKDSFATDSALRSVSQLLLRNKGRVLSIKTGQRLGKKTPLALTPMALQSKGLGLRSPVPAYQRLQPAFQALNHAKNPVCKTSQVAKLIHVQARVLTRMANQLGGLGN